MGSRSRNVVPPRHTPSPQCAQLCLLTTHTSPYWRPHHRNMFPMGPVEKIQSAAYDHNHLVCRQHIFCTCFMKKQTSRQDYFTIYHTQRTPILALYPPSGGAPAPQRTAPGRRAVLPVIPHDLPPCAPRADSGIGTGYSCSDGVPLLPAAP